MICALPPSKWSGILLCILLLSARLFRQLTVSRRCWITELNAGYRRFVLHNYAAESIGNHTCVPAYHSMDLRHPACLGEKPGTPRFWWCCQIYQGTNQTIIAQNNIYDVRLLTCSLNYSAIKILGGFLQLRLCDNCLGYATTASLSDRSKRHVCTWYQRRHMLAFCIPSF